MLKRKLKNGLTYYIVSAQELTKIGGMGICDHCNNYANAGYLIPVLNHWVCPECFEKWSSYAEHYDEDDEIEERNCRYYEKMIPLTEVEK